MSPKQRIPYLYTNNSAQHEAARRRQQRVQNLERAPVPTSDITNTYELKIPRKPINPMIPVYGPAGSPSSSFVIGVIHTDGGGNNFYAELSTTQEWSESFAYNPAHVSPFSISPYALRGLGTKRFVIEIGGTPDFMMMRSQDSGQTWQPTNRQMFDYDIAADGRLWADEYSSGGIFVSEDDGETWTSHGPLPTGRIECVACHPTNPLVIAYVDRVSQSNWLVFTTIDGGDTWENNLHIIATEGFSSGGADRINLGYTPDNTLAVVYEDNGTNKIQVSDDLGETWSLRATFTDGANNVLPSGSRIPGQFFPSVGGKIWCVDGEALSISRLGIGGSGYTGPRPAAVPIISTDNGITWQAVSTGSIPTISTRLLETFSILNTLYTANSGNPVVWSSPLTSPTSWTSIPDPVTGFEFFDLHCLAPININA